MASVEIRRHERQMFLTVETRRALGRRLNEPAAALHPQGPPDRRGVERLGDPVGGRADGQAGVWQRFGIMPCAA
jgi:hypothetical protein